MACYHPITAWRGERLESGKRGLVFDKTKEKQPGSEMQIPCGQCIGCRLERSRQWAMRCVHEASLYKENCFLTLTYDDDNLPEGGTLVKEDFQKFMKRLRKRFPDRKPRYFQCGEYGETYGRPHYHACLFNFDFDDKVIWSVKNGFRLYTSEMLNKIWGHGYCVIGDVTFDSAAYVARYIMKKVTGEKADEHYNGKEPEYTTMSRRPGIGKGWYEKYKNDIYPHDYAVVNGKKVRPAKYYDNQFDMENPDEFKKIKSGRKSKIKHINSRIKILAGYPDEIVDNTIDRLIVKEGTRKQKIEMFKRDYEKKF